MNQKLVYPLALLTPLCGAVNSANSQWIKLTPSRSNEVPALLSYDSALFICANEEGLLKSTDAGQTTFQVFNNPRSYQIYSICFIGKIGIIGTDIGMFRSTNLGATWSAIPESSLGSLTADALMAKDSLLIGGSNTGIFTSTDSGQSWQLVRNDNMVATSCLASLDSVILAGSDVGWSMPNNTLGGIWRSTDFGSNWTRSTLPDSIPVTSFATIGQKIFAGTVNGVLSSDDAGFTWKAIDTGLANLDVLSLTADGTNLFAGTNRGVFLSTNNGTSWSWVGLETSIVLSLAVGSSHVFAGTDNYVWRLPLAELDPKLYNLGVNGTINDTVSFGRVPVGNTALRSVSPYNAGKEPLTIQPVAEPGDDFATSDLSSPESLDSGESFSFEVFFQPKDTGYHSATVTLISQVKIINVFLTGTGYDAGDVNNSPALKYAFSAYPNPLSQSTTISLSLPTSTSAEISIVNPLGSEVAQIFSGELSAGEHNFTWEPTGLPNGLYECLVRRNGRVETLPIMLLR